MSKKTQLEAAKDYLAAHKVAEVFGTADGFLFEKPQHAFSHAATLENKEVSIFNAGGAKVIEQVENTEETPLFLKDSVKSITANLPNVSDVAVLEGYVAFEKQTSQPRSTAIAAIEARIAELK